MNNNDYWDGFSGYKWQKEIDVKSFIQDNFNPYYGDDSFLTDATNSTKLLWKQCVELNKKEQELGGVYDMDTNIISMINSHSPGYLNKDLEKIVGFQTDKPYKRSLQPFGGIRMAENAAKSYGYKVSEQVSNIFNKYRKTHNQGVFDAYTKDMVTCRKTGIITGLPDAYGRGRIIGDYRRIALYGIDSLMQKKKRFL